MCPTLGFPRLQLCAVFVVRAESPNRRPHARNACGVTSLLVNVLRRGAAGSRTPDLRRAKAALSQLSYSPVTWRRDAWWAIVDSNHGPHPYQGCALTT